jgi:CheY-like chemotaxis protein
MWNMVGRSGGPAERRGSPRVPASGSVLVDVAGSRGRISDLSASGVRFQLAAAGARCAVGSPIGLHLRLDGGSPGWFTFGGLVTRVSDDRTISVAFTLVPREFAQAIRDELQALGASAAVPHVLIVDPDSARQVLVTAALRTAGCDVTAMSTPVEAINYLEHAGTEPWIVAVGDTAPPGIADELRTYLRGSHVLIKLVAISEESGDPDDDETGLAADDPHAPTSRVARLVASRLN